MAQLRNGMRALTLDESDPGRTMTKLNRLLDGITDAPFATVAYLTLDPKTHAATLVSAGHLPPLVIEPSGETRFLEEGRNLPLGVDADVPLEGRPGAPAARLLVILYTDGLVERAEHSIDDGLDRLAAVTVPADGIPSSSPTRSSTSFSTASGCGTTSRSSCSSSPRPPARPLELTLPGRGRLPSPASRRGRGVARA